MDENEQTSEDKKFKTMMAKLEQMGMDQKDAHQTLNGTIMDVRDQVIEIKADVRNSNGNMARDREEFRDSITKIHQRANVTEQNVAKNQQALTSVNDWVEKIDKKTESQNLRIGTVETKLGVTKKKNGLAGRDWAYIIGAIAAAIATILGTFVAYNYNNPEEPTPIVAPEIPE